MIERLPIHTKGAPVGAPFICTSFFIKLLQVIKLLPIFAENLKDMPTIFTLFGYRFLFYSNDHTPIHVHVVKGGAKAKFNLFPVELVDNQGFKPTELKMIEAIIEENVETIAKHWNMFFNNNK